MQKHMHYDAADLPAIEDLTLKSGQFTEDAGLFTARELDFVKAQTYTAKLPPMLGLTLIPTGSEAPEYAETITMKAYDEAGMAKIIANYADDLPRADVSAKERTVRVKDLGASYGYNLSELKASVALGKNLPARKAQTARRAIEIKLNQIAMIGDEDYGLFGLTNHPNIGETTLPSNKAWTDAATTADEILDDLNALYNAVRLQSKTVHRPNRFILPTTSYGVLFSKRLGDTGGLTVGEFFQKQHSGVQLIEAPELENVNGKKLVIVGEFDNLNISHELVMGFNQLPAENRNLELIVNCLARTAGVSVHYPLAFTKAELK